MGELVPKAFLNTIIFKSFVYLYEISINTYLYVVRASSRDKIQSMQKEHIKYKFHVHLCQAQIETRPGIDKVKPRVWFKL